MPSHLMRHIADRARERGITLADLQRLQTWAASGPQAPEGNWYKDFGTYIVCGTGEFVKTILEPHMTPHGESID